MKAHYRRCMLQGCAKRVEGSKAFLPRVVRAAGRVSCLSEQHPAKAPEPMVVTVSGRAIEVKEAQFMKAPSPMVVTVAGRVRWVREVPSKARGGMVTRSFGRRKCGWATRASIPPMHQAARVPIPPGIRQRSTAANNTARAWSSSCAAARHALEAAAKRARQCVSRFSATIASSSAGSDDNVRGSSATAFATLSTDDHAE
mmetsp:Transcript_23758/g.56658  ORF Transcript_23758/g.56658 Transcript_23758/m.56658 type:complete len:200 (+) Transcript_23758:151-750(+)|eukprot:scaffold63462_cov52-Phaeocystis_antarctica.AAC.6